MKIGSYPQISITKRISAALLAVWMSGVALLFCCEMPKADSCPLAKLNHCDKPSESESVSQFASFQTNNQVKDCCRFLPNVFDKARKIEHHPQAAEAASSIRISLPKFLIIKFEFAAPTPYYSPVLNHSGAYLKNRTLRI